MSSYADPVEGRLAFVKEHVTLPDGRAVGVGLGADPWVEERVLRPMFLVGEKDLAL